MQPPGNDPAGRKYTRVMRLTNELRSRVEKDQLQLMLHADKYRYDHDSPGSHPPRLKFNGIIECSFFSHTIFLSAH